MKENKKEITDKDVLYFLHSMSSDKPVTLELLAYKFKLMDGEVYFNSEKTMAVGFYADKGMLKIVFFKILKDEKVKFVDSRGITITEELEATLRRTIEICKIKQKTNGNEDTFYHG